jgi:predicted molibdopterin-dependent oxidoreductase YjgC
MTRKVDILNALMSEEELQISPPDAASLGIHHGDMVRVASHQGEVKVRAKVTGAVPEGVVHMAFHFAETPTNELISASKDTLDPVTGTPAYKNCPVRVSRCEPENGAAAMVAILHRASRDSAFAGKLFRDGGSALKEYVLSDTEKTAVTSGDVKKIEEITGRLDERVRTWLLAAQSQGNSR